MKKFLLSAMLMLSALAYSQIPYFAGTIGDGKMYTYTSLKYQLKDTSLVTYSTFNYGIGNHFAIGADLWTGAGTIEIGYTLRAGIYYSKYFNIGVQATPSFNLTNKHKFDYFTGAVYMNGCIYENLFWVSNTWLSVDRSGNFSPSNWWYLGYTVHTDKVDITPMAGIIHSWKFDQKPSASLGVYFTKNKFDYYIWCDQFEKGLPRFVIGFDYTFNCKD